MMLHTKNVFWRVNWTRSWLSIVVICKLQMTNLRLKCICRPHECTEGVWVLILLISPMYHTITSFKCALMRHLLIWLWLSSVVLYKLQMPYPRLELMHCPNGCIEEICWLQLVYFITYKLHNTSTKCVLKRAWIWTKLSIIAIVRALLDIFFEIVDISSKWMYITGLNTWTC